MKASLALCVMEINLHGTIREEEVDVPVCGVFNFAFFLIMIFQ
jgi:hypothetical protein